MSTIAELEARVAQYKAELAEAQALNATKPAVSAAPLKLDLGCGNTTRRGISGKTKENGWTGVDLPETDGADAHLDVGADRWPWADSSVDEVNCAHLVEHLPVKVVELRPELEIDWVNHKHSLKLTKIITRPRLHFFNELWRVLKNGAKASVVTPHWCSCRAYGDITHEWPPVSEMFWQYLNKEWRDQNAPHVGFNCHFEVGYGYLTATWLQAEVANRNQEFVTQKTNEALSKYKEAAQDMFATLTARK